MTRHIGLTCLLAILMAAGTATAERPRVVPVKPAAKQGGNKRTVVADAKPAPLAPMPAPVVTEAHRRFLAAQEHVKQGDYKSAITVLHLAVGERDATPSQRIAILWNIGHLQMELIKSASGYGDQLVLARAARAAFVECSDIAVERPTMEDASTQRQCKDDKAATDTLIRVLSGVVETTPPTANEPLKPPPGMPNRPIVEQPRVVVVPQPKVVRVEKIDGDESFGKKYGLSIGLGASGGALLVTGIALWAHSLKAVGDLREQDEACGGMCNLQPKADGLQTQFYTGVAFNIGGLVLGAVATTLGIIKHRAERPPKAGAMSFIPRSDGGELAITF
jgi:hypothetical protein